MDPLELTAIWQLVNTAGGCIADCVKKSKGPTFPIRDDLAEAEAALSKAHIRVRQLLADRNLK